MTRLKQSYRKVVMLSVLILATLMTSLLPAQPAQAAGYPSLTYVRFNRYGANIYATYCIAADYYDLIWGESSPTYWYDQRSYGAINGCVTKYLFAQVQGNENLFTAFETRSNVGGIANYGFLLYPRGSSSLTCDIDYNGTYLRRDPRLNSSTACAFWDQ